MNSVFVPTVFSATSLQMTPENFAQAAKKVLGEKLVSSILYGSAAAGDRLKKGSDFNILLVIEPLGQAEMTALAPIVKRWMTARNPAPLLFTSLEVTKSCDVFPIEMLDMKQSHHVLTGKDVVKDLEVSLTNLRHQVEFELRSKILRLRDSCVKAGNSKSALIKIMVSSFSSVMSVLRAALRLYQSEVPPEKMPALAALEKYVRFDKTPFEAIHSAKGFWSKIKRSNARDVFANYLKQLETITDAVDALVR